MATDTGENHLRGVPSQNGLRQATRSHVSPDVLPIRTLCLSLFGSLFQSSNQHSRWGAAPNARCCGGQELPFTGVGASGKPGPPTLIRLTNSLQKHQRLRYPRKATALRRRSAAAVHFWPGYSTSLRASRVPLQPWLALGYSTLLRAARVPLQPSNCCLHLVIPSHPRNGDCHRIAERLRFIARCGDERQPRAHKLTSLSASVQ